MRDQSSEAPQWFPVTQQGAPGHGSQDPRNASPPLYQVRLPLGTHREVCSIVQWGCDSLIVQHQHLPVLQISTKCLQTSSKMQTACTTSHTAWQPQARKPPNTQILQLGRTHGTETHVWHMQTSHKPTDLPKPPEEPQYGTILSNAPATGMTTFPPCSLGTAQPDATAALCQPKHLRGVQLQMGTCPSHFPEEVKLRAKNLRARPARQEFQETPQLARQGICKLSHPPLLNRDLSICSTSTWEF